MTNKEKFLEAVETETEAALKECGVTDANVRKDVKDEMLKLGSDMLAGATQLKNLSDFIASIKTKAAELAKKHDESAKAGVQS